MLHRLPLALTGLFATFGSVAAGIAQQATARPPISSVRASDVARKPPSPTPSPRSAPAADTLGASYTYDAVGNRIRTDYGNGLVTEYRYDRRDRLIELRTSRGETPMNRYEYTLDPSGLRVRVDATEQDGTTRVTRYPNQRLGSTGRRVMKLWFEEIGSEGCLGRGRNSIR